MMMMMLTSHGFTTMWWILMFATACAGAPSSFSSQTSITKRAGPLLLSQLDPSFCSLSYHSSILVNGQLLLTNGEIIERHGQQPLSNIWALDMTENWNTTEGPVLLSNTSQPAGNYPASKTCNSALWSTADDLIAFGGERYYLENSRVPPAQIYNYSLSTSTWASTTDITEANDTDLVARACGSYAQSDQGVGYYLGGYRSKDNDPTATNTRLNTGMLAVDLANGSTTTLSTLRLTTKINGLGTNVGGQINYIGSVGQQGIVVAIGGLTLKTTANFSWSPAPELSLYNDMSDIAVFDIASQRWYHQTAFSAADNGVDARTQFCSVVVSAPDNSSHQIYIYGGYNTGKNFDSVHVLSIPSFQWTVAAAPSSYVSRFVHSCNVVGNRQLLVTGGSQKPVNNQNIVTGAERPCTSATLFEIFDLTTHQWTNTYNATAAAYKVNADLVDLIGGNSTGGARVQDPIDGWTDPDLKAIFKVSRASSTNSTTPTSLPSPTSTTETPPSQPKASKAQVAAIAGGIAGLVVLGLAVLALWYCIKRRRRDEQAAGHVFELETKPHVVELPVGAEQPPVRYELPGSEAKRLRESHVDFHELG